MSGEAVTFEGICRGAIQRVALEAASRGQKISFSTDGLIGKAHVDPVQLARILQDLLNNAIRFTPENGELGIDLACIAGGRSVAVTVWDHGCGIAASKQDDLFRPRTQLRKEAVSRHGGKNLGLLMVKCLTERCGGRIEAESEEGKGSRFSLVFPNLSSRDQGRDDSAQPTGRKIPVLSCMRQLLLVFSLCIPGFAQVTEYGADKNICCPLFVAGDPPAKPKIGTSMTLEWWFDLWQEGWGVLAFGPDISVKANICHYSNHPADMLDKWMLIPPLFHIDKTHWSATNGALWEYYMRIPDNPSMIGKAVRAQAFLLADPQFGGTNCSRLRATSALRIQFLR